MLNTITKEQLKRFSLRGVNIMQNKRGALLAVTTEALELLPSCYEPIAAAAAPLTKLKRYEAIEASKETQSNVLTSFFKSLKHVYSSYNEDLTQ